MTTLARLRELAQLLKPGASMTDVVFGAALVAQGDGDAFASVLYYVGRHGSEAATAAQAIERAIRHMELSDGR